MKFSTKLLPHASRDGIFRAAYHIYTQTKLMANRAVFDGYCPESKLRGIIAEMQLNEDDFWESRETGLQITTFPPYAAILAWRGKGNFKIHVQNASEHRFKLILTKASKKPGKEIFPDKRAYFKSENEIKVYLQTIK